MHKQMQHPESHMRITAISVSLTRGGKMNRNKAEERKIPSVG